MNFKVPQRSLRASGFAKASGYVPMYIGTPPRQAAGTSSGYHVHDCRSTAVDAFGAIGSGAAGASIQALAPGVSGALLTTVAGLLVAIPSVFGYNYLLTETKIMITELENFASSFADRVELEAIEMDADEQSAIVH